MTFFTRVIFVTLILHVSQSALAANKIVQILHTNDLHSHWTSTPEKQNGGFARIKVLMDKLEAEGNAKGWVTIRLDAGDFSEGHINYFANNGNGSFEIMKQMNYDVITLGNHDYLTNVSELERQVLEGRALPLVAANFIWPNKRTNVEPGRVIVRGGLRIAVAGATTDEKYYLWAAKPALIEAPAAPVDAWLSEQKADLKIALTHLGLELDKLLVQNTKSVDIVVGGHSHTAMHEPFWMFSNLTKRPVPIVQTGAHGHYLGQTIIQLPKGARTKILSYKLLPISLDMPEDQVIAGLVASNRQIVAQTLNVNLDEVVATSSEFFSSWSTPVPIVGNYFADILRETAKTDIAIDFGTIYGSGFNKGDITIEDVLMLQPHIYDWSSGGWHVMSAKIKGDKLKLAMKLISLQINPVFVSGMDVKMRKTRAFDHFLINGEEVDENREYTVALSEGFLKGVEANSLYHIFFKPPYVDTGLVYRDVIFERTVKIGHISESLFGKPRVVWPGSSEPFSLQ